MKNSLSILKMFLWFISLFHIIVGVGLNFVPNMPQMMANIYGATVSLNPQFVYILKPLGAFMLILGVFAAVAAKDPRSHRVIIYGFVALFCIRALQRLLFQADIQQIFAISAGKNMINMVFFLGMAGGLFLMSKNLDKA